jgi:excisionase family DNA binding protein
MKTTLSVVQFADALGVSRDTVERWVKLGKVKGFKLGPFPGKTSPILIPASEMERVKKLQNEQTK